MKYEEFHRRALGFLDALFDDLQKNNITLDSHWDIDHLCYRVENLECYHELKGALSQFARLLIESEVNGRPIATFKLPTPVSYQGWKIDVVELPAPKPGKNVREGFEHIEIVSGVSFAELESRFSHLPLDRGGLRKDFNPELEIALGERNLKFHPLSLESVIRTETNSRVWNALMKSKILALLKPESPLIAGTFPLGIATEASDVDVLIQSADFSDVERKLRSLGVDLKTDISVVDGRPTLLANFEFDGVPFEVFAQDFPSVRQRAYRHFLIEEKLLKRGGAPLREKILLLRGQGLKTEPAFAHALGLTGDPYEALLQIEDEG